MRKVQRIKRLFSWHILIFLMIHRCFPFKTSVDYLSNKLSIPCSPRSHTHHPYVHQLLIVRHLNRILFEPEELTRNENEYITILSGEDPRTKHIYKILKAQTGDTIRVGVLDGGVNDEAKIEWQTKETTQHKQKIPDLKVHVGESGRLMEPVPEKHKPQVSLLLALPRPLQLERMLPMISSLGVRHLILSAAQKVEKDYFGSHLFKKENEHALKQALVDGLAQCGDTVVPEVKVVRRLKIFLEDDLDVMFPRNEYVRIISHPNRLGHPPLPRMRDVSLPTEISGDKVKILLAVGPEGGWAEPYELDLFQKHRFQGVSLGERVLRSDVAVCSLLALAHDWINKHQAI